MRDQNSIIFIIIALIAAGCLGKATSISSDVFEALFTSKKYDQIFDSICPQAWGYCSAPIETYQKADFQERQLITGVHLLGEGSYGEVYSIEGQWAVKVMKLDSLHLLKSAMMEINIGLKIQESNLSYLTPIHDCCMKVTKGGYFSSDQYTFFIGMPLYSLGTLWDFMKNNDNRKIVMTADWKWSMIFGLLKGLKDLHNANYSHRDLKPMNILMESPYRLRISDFGFTRKIQDKAYTMLGTPAYMAPEILSHKPYDNKVDIYSAGLIMFQILNVLGYKHSTVKVKDLAKYCDGHSFSSYTLEKLEWESYCISGLSELILEMTSTDPNYRPSAKQVLERITNSPQEFFDREKRAIKFTEEMSSLPIGNPDSEYRIRQWGDEMVPMVRRPSYIPQKQTLLPIQDKFTPKFYIKI